MLKDQFFMRNQEKIQFSPLVSVTDRNYLDVRQPKMESGAKVEVSTNARRYFVENLGEDMLLVDSEKKNPNADKMSIIDLPLLQRGEFGTHFFFYFIFFFLSIKIFIIIIVYGKKYVW